MHQRDHCRPASDPGVPEKPSSFRVPCFGSSQLGQQDGSGFGFKFPGEERFITNQNPQLRPNITKVGDKVEEMCGKVHAKQISAVCYVISQSGAGSKVKSAFVQQGIRNDEHMALTFTLAKDDATGAVTVTCTEPAGFPVHFSWTVTVALDGTTTSTPLVVAA